MDVTKREQKAIKRVRGEKKTIFNPGPEQVKG